MMSGFKAFTQSWRLEPSNRRLSTVHRDRALGTELTKPDGEAPPVSKLSAGKTSKKASSPPAPTPPFMKLSAERDAPVGRKSSPIKIRANPKNK